MWETHLPRSTGATRTPGNPPVQNEQEPQGLQGTHLSRMYWVCEEAGHSTMCYSSVPRSKARLLLSPYLFAVLCLRCFSCKGRAWEDCVSSISDKTESWLIHVSAFSNAGSVLPVSGAHLQVQDSSTEARFPSHGLC